MMDIIAAILIICIIIQTIIIAYLYYAFVIPFMPMKGYMDAKKRLETKQIDDELDRCLEIKQ